MSKLKALSFLLLLILLASMLTGCGKSKSLDEDQYAISTNSYYGQTTFTIYITDPELFEQNIEALSVKIKYYNYYEKAKTETFDVYLAGTSGSFSVDEIVIDYDCKKVEAHFEGEAPDGDKPGILTTIGIALIAWLFCFFVVFIPRAFFDEDGSMSLGIAGAIYLILTIYAYAAWGIGRGIIFTVGLASLGFLMSTVVDKLQELWDDYIRYR